jgi:hypothetical protein
MADTTLVSQIKTAVAEAAGMVTYSDHSTEEFQTLAIAGQKATKVTIRHATLFQVNFATHAAALTFANSISSMLPYSNTVSIVQLASDDFQVYFDP